jgi:hypothetical protein
VEIRGIIVPVWTCPNLGGFPRVVNERVNNLIVKIQLPYNIPDSPSLIMSTSSSSALQVSFINLLILFVPS